MRKPAVAALATTALLAGALAAAPPASADSGVAVLLPISGTTTLANGLAGKPTLTLPDGARIRGTLDLAASTVVGTMEVPPMKAKVRALGIPVLGDTTSTVDLVPEGKTVATIGADGYVSAQTSFRIALPEVRSDLPLFDLINLGGPTCRTGLITTTLVSGAPFDLAAAIPMSATYTVPKLTGCPKLLGISLNDALLSGLLAGDGNTLDLAVGPVQPDTSVPTTPPTTTPPTTAPEPAPKPAARARSTVVAKATKVTWAKAGRVTVRIRPSRSATGRVRVYAGKRLLASKVVRDGRATLRLRKKALRPGKHRLRVVYAGNRTLRPSTDRVTVRVVRR